MIACIIEFGVKDGRDQDRKRLLAESFVELDKLPVGCSMRRTSAQSGWGSGKSSATTTSNCND